MRRSDRAGADEEWIKALLRRAPIGVLATVHAIYFHTARMGRTRANVESTEQVCFSVYEMGRLLPADTALEFSVEYASVVIFGRATRIDDAQQAATALYNLLHKYAPRLQPARDYRPIVPGKLVRSSVYRLAIEEWSGKQKAVPENFPGAYTYESAQRSCDFG
jgi:hypothetical protein